MTLFHHSTCYYIMKSMKKGKIGDATTFGQRIERVGEWRYPINWTFNIHLLLGCENHYRYCPSCNLVIKNK